MGSIVEQKKWCKLVLVGGGHGHVYVLKQLQQVQWPHVEVLLLSPSRYQFYSGMFSGYVEGLYNLEQICVDILILASNAGVKWVQGSAVKIHPDRQIVETDQGEAIDYDIISFDVGSLTAGAEIPGVVSYAEVIKPTYLLPQVLDRLSTKQEIVVVGGGASGIELSLAMQARRRKEGKSPAVKLVSSGELLQGYGRGVQEKIEKIVRAKGVKVFLNHKVKKVEPHFLVTASEYKIPYDALVWLAGPKAHPIFRNSRLGVDDQGYLLVTATLQAKDYPNIFGIGDCVGIMEYPHLAKAGVYAVREAPILWNNIQSYMEGGTPLVYHPQADFLSILSTGDQQGFLLYKGMTMHGKWVWKLKKRIDSAFMRHFSEPKRSKPFFIE
jgi:pyridine nucleotide-disulfide oxidoreductase family protein